MVQNQILLTPTTLNLILTFLKLGFISFGGPAMVEYLRQSLVVSKRWIDEETFTKGLVTCQSLPGAIVVNLASYCGYQIKGLCGMSIGLLFFLLPSFFIMFLFSYFYTEGRDLTLIKSAFTGLEVIVVAIVLNSTVRFVIDNLKGNIPALLMAMASAGLLLLKTNPLLVIVLMTVLGMLTFSSIHPSTISVNIKSISRKDSILIVTTILLVYGLIIVFFHHTSTLVLTMTKIALMSFGGVYTALPLMYHEVVEFRQWMDSKTFMDGIALGQVTPGPILINAVFVGYQVAGLAGSISGAFAIFAPGPLLLSVALPFIGKIDSSRYFKSATKGMVSAFAGLLIFVSIKFVTEVHWLLSKMLFLAIALAWLGWKNNVLVLAIIGGLASALFFL